MSTDWTDVAAEGDLFEGAAIGVGAEGRDIALYKTEAGEVFATDNICSHGYARLCDGFLEGHEIECPFHQGRFDIRTGEPTLEPCVDAIKSYPVKVEGGRVWLQIQT
ncbi:non-heme iron oxygenase ferredoxin subunit [Ottowia sp. GY511]|uniref:Non-heme iron oxygenase ferredoxin subunit n=1 Tax=Ottowia flava TaxID=2675430 RepID=A0ABW4KVY5_9BURK|nr:non-heme iron oxygenase ferredoxin subunit [Ottowia sp. GY511]TXK30942.1 non-heme iron oxygenase ferredoxin subunit [Ottowia sp. GY511]